MVIGGLDWVERTLIDTHLMVRKNLKMTHMEVVVIAVHQDIMGDLSGEYLLARVEPLRVTGSPPKETVGMTNGGQSNRT